MSWSFNSVGKPAAVAKAARAAKDTGKCIEPEEGYRLDTLESIAKMSESIVGECAVQVSAGGSMWKDGDVVKSHTTALDFKVLYGFVE